ncbi:MFS transporter [Luteitalea pratensis]|uniref:MFS transporter n=1 Tax=Luteitalea pratensis TaxID=1855912 RepID=UPI001F1BF592|nr:MFS transporter [Luteitalea pratensis]
MRGLRWYIGGLLFLSTVVNYIDRQTLSVLAPELKKLYGWTNSDFARVLIAFRVAYAVGQTIAGRVIDHLGTRRGLSVGVAWYSLAAISTAWANGLGSFMAARFALGLGEAGNWPGATKAVSEWFPRRESGWAVALFDSGSSVGAAIAPWLVLSLYATFGSWRPAFIITGALGFLWMALFLVLYRKPEDHPLITEEERDMILRDRNQVDPAENAGGEALPYATLLRLPQTWGYIVSKSFTDPVWFFITDWFAIYLVSRGFSVEEGLLAFWVPFLAADAGNFFGGGVSSWLIKRGWSVGAARKAIGVIGTVGMTLLVPTIFVDTLPAIIACFAVSTFAYAAFSTVILNLPADLFAPPSVASVSGMGGTGAGLGTIAAIYVTGRVADHYSFAPIMVGASVLPLVALVAMLALVRNTEATRRGLVREV